ncbi:MAG TPA: metallophosphatase [Prolixibacteraceae bacterium]|nr:metallophosphatase [Prolixibacteraceae bacterium]
MGGLPMNRRIFIKNLAAGSAGLAAGLAPFQGFSKNDLLTLTLLHTNDLHSQIEPFDANHPRYAGRAGLARVAGFANACRLENPNLLLLDAGDFFQGTPYFNFFKGDIMLNMMTEMGYDAGTIGNHEFDNGLEGLRDPLPHAGFPLINSNYDFSDTILSGKFPRYKIFKKSGLRIGIYGLGIQLRGLVNEKQHGAVRYNDPIPVALEMEKFLALEKKCDLVVCLSHLGLRYQNDKISDVSLAPELSYTDVIIGGHTHSFLEEPLQIRNKAGEMTIVNQAHYGGLMVGKLDFVFREGSRKRSGLRSSQQKEL